MAIGGDATAITIDTHFYSSQAVANATGGADHHGKSGDAFAQAQAHSIGSEESPVKRRFGAIAIARALKSNVSLASRQPAFGTNSKAESTAISEDGLPVIAIASAHGGWGYISSGTSNASATAAHRSGDIARSDAYSVSIADHDLGMIGDTGSTIELEFLVDLQIDRPTDSYGFSFVIGNADPRTMAFGATQNQRNVSSVPEPSGEIAIEIVTLGLVYRRRRSSRI